MTKTSGIIPWFPLTYDTKNVLTVHMPLVFRMHDNYVLLLEKQIRDFLASQLKGWRPRFFQAECMKKYGTILIVPQCDIIEMMLDCELNCRAIE